MARSNADNSNQEDSQQENREDSEPSRNSNSFHRRKASRSVSTEYHSIHLKSHAVVKEGKRILVLHPLKDQEPLGAKKAEILVLSQIISRT